MARDLSVIHFPAFRCNKKSFQTMKAFLFPLQSGLNSNCIEYLFGAIIKFWTEKGIINLNVEGFLIHLKYK